MNPPSILQWVSDNLFELVNLLLGFAGFIFLWIQTSKARSAAQAAKEATDRALKGISTRFTISDIASITSGFREVQVALRGNRYEAGVIRIQALRSQLFQLRQRGGFKNVDGKLAGIQKMVTGLRKLQDSVERKLDDPNASLSVPDANSILADYVELLSGWAEEIRLGPGSEE